MRNDSLLYTGITSATARKTQAKAEEQGALKKDKQSRIAPAAQEVMDMIDAEQKNIAQEILKLVRADTTSIEADSFLKAYKLYDTKLNSFRIKLKNTLRRQVREIGEVGDNDE